MNCLGLAAALWRSRSQTRLRQRRAHMVVVDSWMGDSSIADVFDVKGKLDRMVRGTGKFQLDAATPGADSRLPWACGAQVRALLVEDNNVTSRANETRYPRAVGSTLLIAG